MSFVCRWLRTRRCPLFLATLGLLVFAFVSQDSSDDIFSRDTSRLPLHRIWMHSNLESLLSRLWRGNSSQAAGSDVPQDMELEDMQPVRPVRTLEIFHLSEEHKKKKREDYVCKPKTHIVFLKTHKTGSSTLQNMLYRYGDTNNLTFALPRAKNPRFNYPTTFQAHYVEGVETQKFHILCNHMRFKKSEIVKVMPADTFYFSILRHPVPMLESMFNYYKILSRKYKGHSIGEYLDKCWRTYNPSKDKGDYTHNNLAFDFGFNNAMTSESADLQEQLDELIGQIEETFHLILINDYFDESLILLKHALCWSLEDMVTFKINSRKDDARKEVPEETVEKIKRWNALDWGLYLHFNATFWNKVDTVLGREELNRQVAELRDFRANLEITCLKGGGAVEPSEIRDKNLKPFQGSAIVLGYNLNPSVTGATRRMCLQLITPELQYHAMLYDRQFPRQKVKH